MSVLPYKALYKHYRKNSLQLVLLIISLVLSISLLVSVLEINVLTKSVMVNNQANYLDEFRYTIAPIKKTGPSVYKQYQLINNKVPDKCLILQNAKLRTLNHSIDLTLIDPLQLKRLNKGNSQVFLKNITQKLEQNNVLLTPNAARGINIQSNEPFAQHINQNRNFDFYITNLFWGEPNVILASKNYKTHNLASFTKESQHISCINLSSDSLEKVFSVVDKDFRFEKKQTYNFKPITQYFYILLFTIGMLAFCIGIFVFYQTMSLSFAQRQILIGQLRKLGLSRIKIIFIFLLEIIAFLLLGLFFGNIIGFWLVNLSISELSYTFERIYGFSLYNSPAWDYSWLKVSFSLAFIGLLLAFGWPILRVVKINSKDLAKHISFYYILKREYLWQAITSLAVFIISVIMLISLDIEWKYKEYLFLIAFVICSSLIFPYFLRLITQFLSKVSKNNLIKWFFLDISSSLSFRTISTVLLLLSFIGMISIQILVKNYEHNSNTWLEKKYKYDFEISLQSSEYEPVLSWLESQRDVNNIHIKMINYSYFRKKLLK
ncbi:hypothetical protein CF386_06585 [Paraphotobacterium marinum]|uniref:Uncharacterized protein n=1 Tax=Paraphotobacterium marinum TaxID=1755811 RepID=A0A220VEP1_9GAMM|nr:FtsX-like permease family protein [Paraphotobacterium marinum]ASK78686.1 hypothetical protein CF386_06585 [Paraphotobacterium marinum]